jgi:transcriptional regulator with XRE-family HTH domain
MNDLTFGQRLRMHRERAGMSRPVLGGLVGRSTEWVKHVENGRLAVPRLSMLIRLAEVLGIADLADLTGDQSMTIPRFAHGEHPSVPAIRAAVQRYRLGRPTRPPQPVATLRERTALAWRAWHQSPNRRTDVGAVLPDLLTDCQDTVAVLDGSERRDANAVLAEVYHLAQHVLVNAALQPGRPGDHRRPAAPPARGGTRRRTPTRGTGRPRPDLTHGRLYPIGMR